MATIAPTSMLGSGQRTLVETTLTASNVFAYAQGSGQILILRNATGGAIRVKPARGSPSSIKRRFSA